MKTSPRQRALNPARSLDIDTRPAPLPPLERQVRQFMNNPGTLTETEKSVNIKAYWVLRHFKASQNDFVLRFKGGTLKDSGRGLSFFFRDANTNIATVPLDDRSLPIFIKARSVDFQEVNVQGIITYRVLNAEMLADRIDHTISTSSGKRKGEPDIKIESLVNQVATKAVVTYLGETDLATILAEGLGELSGLLVSTFSNSPELEQLGIALVAVSVGGVTPRADVEKALQTPKLADLEQKSDEALFARRASAVEKERAIQENEAKTKLVLAEKQAQLIDQNAKNQLAEAQELAARTKVSIASQVESLIAKAEADAKTIELKAHAENAAEQEKVAIYAAVEGTTLLAMAALAFAETGGFNVEHLTITPDMLSNLAAALTAGGAQHALGH